MPGKAGLHTKPTGLGLGVSWWVNTSVYQEASARQLHGELLCLQSFQTHALYLFIWLFICVLDHVFGYTVNQYIQVSLRSMSYSSQRSNSRGGRGGKLELQPIVHKDTWKSGTWGWCLRWGRSCGTEPFMFELRLSLHLGLK